MADGQHSSGGPSTNRASLESLIGKYLTARAIWLGASAPDLDLVADGLQFEAVEAASQAVIYHHCESYADIRRKILLVLGDPDLRAMIREDENKAGDSLKGFLASLLPPFAAPNSYVELRNK